MSKLVKMLLKFSFVLVIAVVVAVICVMIFVDPNNYKADINHVVQKYTNRELDIHGKIKWALTPQVTLCVQDITLKNTQDFRGALLKINKANIKLSLIGLLQKKVIIKGINLQKPELYLIKTKNGTTNFDDLLSSTDTVQSSASLQQQTATENKTKQNSFTIMISKLVVQDSKIQWQDSASDTNILIYGLNVSARDFDLQSTKPLPPISISGNIKDLTNKFKDEIAFSTKITANIAKQTAHIEPLHINMQNVHASGKLTVAKNNDIIKIAPIVIDISGSKHQASVVIDVKHDTPLFSIREETNTFEINKLLSELAQFKKLHGNTKLISSLKARGNQPEQLKSSLQGTIDFNMQQGRFDGIDVHKILKQAEATLQGLFNTVKDKEHINLPSLLSSQIKDWRAGQGTNAKTNFDDLQMNAQFYKGISRETSCTIQHSDYDIKGYGEINLVNETVNLVIKAIYKKVGQSTNSDVGSYMLKTPLTIMVQGNLYSPTVKPDLHAYCKEAIEKLHKELFKNILQKSLNKIILKSAPADDSDADSNPLKKLEQNILDNLFKRKD